MKYFLLGLMISSYLHAYDYPYLDHQYLEPSSIDFTTIPLPPEGEADVAELRNVLVLTKKRSPKDCEKYFRLSESDPGRYFVKPDGPLSEWQYIKYKGLLFTVRHDMLKYIFRLQHFKKRNAPYQRDPEIKLCRDSFVLRSYPSFNATQSTLFGKILAMAFAADKELLLERIDEIHELEVSSGMYHPSDVLAGKVLAEKMFEALLQKKEFLRDFDKPKSFEEKVKDFVEESKKRKK